MSNYGGPSGFNIAQGFQNRQAARQQQDFINAQMQQASMVQQGKAQAAGQIGEATTEALNSSDPTLRPVIQDIGQVYQNAIYSGVANPEMILNRIKNDPRLGLNRKYSEEQINAAWSAINSKIKSTGSGSGWGIGRIAGMLLGGLGGFMLLGGNFSLGGIIAAAVTALLGSWVGGKAERWIGGMFNSSSSPTSSTAQKPATQPGQGTSLSNDLPAGTTVTPNVPPQVTTTSTNPGGVVPSR